MTGSSPTPDPGAAVDRRQAIDSRSYPRLSEALREIATHGDSPSWARWQQHLLACGAGLDPEARLRFERGLRQVQARLRELARGDA